MIIHLLASVENIEDDIANLRRIVDVIHSQGHSLSVNWIEPAYARAIKNHAPARVDWRAVYKENMAATAKADVIIAEATLRSFGTGYAFARAGGLRKPTLILRCDDAEDDNMVVGIDERYTTFKPYNEQTLEKIVISFIKENDYKTKNIRFNVPIIPEVVTVLVPLRLPPPKRANLLPACYKCLLDKPRRCAH